MHFLMHCVSSNPRRPPHLVASQSLSNGKYFLAWKDDYTGLMGIQNLGHLHTLHSPSFHLPPSSTRGIPSLTSFQKFSTSLPFSPSLLVEVSHTSPSNVFYSLCCYALSICSNGLPRIKEDFMKKRVSSAGKMEIYSS